MNSRKVMHYLFVINKLRIDYFARYVVTFKSVCLKQQYYDSKTN